MSNSPSIYPWAAQASPLAPCDLYDLARHTRSITLRQGGLVLVVPVKEIDLGVAEREVYGLVGGGTDHIHGTHRMPPPPPPVPCKTCGVSSPEGECLACFDKSYRAALDEAEDIRQRYAMIAATFRWETLILKELWLQFQ